ncbi:hypothetical protein [Paracoccus sp. (in: a-proteobacteria)]|uniref:hypothetical protein n=1 Tax=Paracoccus sp. TaxID=267 RepID=UPI0035B0ECEB
MAMQSTEFSPVSRPRAHGFFAWLGEGLVSYMESRSRHSQIAALEAKSDEELAKLGITRDRIVHYVFRDLIWV